MCSPNEAFYVFALMALLAGCGERMPQASGNWIPQSTGGSIEIRKLPSAAELRTNYLEWLESDEGPKVRLYETLLCGATNQTEFRVINQKGDTPVGAALVTFVRFIYTVPTNGAYDLSWSIRGRHGAPAFLKATGTPRKLLLKPLLPMPDGQTPRLQIVAIQNVESRRVLAAEQADRILSILRQTNNSHAPLSSPQ
jgi:hypothetical protein